MSETEQFELLYEGASDDTAETMRRVKGVLIADLELPVDRVREILESAPIVIQHATQEESLKRSLNSLRRAGAKVQIVSPKKSDSETDEDGSFTFELDLSDGKPKSTLHSDLDMMLESNDADLKSEVDALLTQLSETEIVKVSRFPAAADTVNNMSPTAREQPTPEAVAETPTAKKTPDSTPAWGLELEAPPPESVPLKEKVIASSQNDSPKEPAIDLLIAPEPLVVTAVRSEPKKTPAKGQSPRVHTDAPLATKAGGAASPSPVKSELKNSIYDNPIDLPSPEGKLPNQERTIAVEISLAKKSGHFELSTETLVTLCLSAIVVVIGNWIYQNIHTHESGGLSVALPTTIQEDLPNISTRDNIVLPTQTLVAVSSANDHELRARIVRQGQSVIGAFLRLTTPPPAPLTPEEIVRGVPPRPWLSKIEAEGLELSQRADGSFRAQGYGRAFVDQGDFHRRLPVEVMMDSSAPSPTGAMRVEVRFTRSIGTVTPLDEITPFLVNNDGTVRINFRSTFTASPSIGGQEKLPERAKPPAEITDQQNSPGDTSIKP